MPPPPKIVPDNLNGREYCILTIQYSVIKWIPQAAAAQAKAMKCSAGDFRGTPFEGFTKDHMSKMKLLSSVVEGTLNAGQHVSNAAESMSNGFKTGMSIAGAAFDQLVGNNQQLKSARRNVSDVLNFAGSQLSGLMGNAVEKMVSQPLPTRDVPEGLSAKEYLDLGIHYKDIGWTEQSRDALVYAIEIDPQGEIGKAAEQFLKTRLPRQPVPQAAVTRNIQGFNLMHANQTEEAKRHFEKLIDDYPAFEWPYSNLGRLYLGLGDTQKADELIRQALEINPFYANAWCNLALVKIIDSDFDDAGKCVEKAKALDPQNTLCESVKTVLDLITKFLQ